MRVKRNLIKLGGAAAITISPELYSLLGVAIGDAVDVELLSTRELGNFLIISKDDQLGEKLTLALAQWREMEKEKK